MLVFELVYMCKAFFFAQVEKKWCCFIYTQIFRSIFHFLCAFFSMNDDEKKNIIKKDKLTNISVNIEWEKNWLECESERNIAVHPRWGYLTAIIENGKYIFAVERKNLELTAFFFWFHSIISSFFLFLTEKR